MREYCIAYSSIPHLLVQTSIMACSQHVMMTVGSALLKIYTRNLQEGSQSHTRRQSQSSTKGSPLSRGSLPLTTNSTSGASELRKAPAAATRLRIEYLAYDAWK